MRKTMLRTAAVLGLSALATVAAAVAADLKVGDKAPEFSLEGTDGKTYKLSDFRGKKAVVVAWFPKAMTKGCTAECKSLKENSGKLKPLNVAYFTASVDTPALNKQFSDQLGLDYPILSDPDKSTAKAYGVLRPDGGVTNRWTFYIDKDGMVREIDKSIKTGVAGDDMAKKIKDLNLNGE
jgi:thioredoxin-dependent peroxiredoxin